jgi:hypothetical protein
LRTARVTASFSAFGSDVHLFSERVSGEGSGVGAGFDVLDGMVELGAGRLLGDQACPSASFSGHRCAWSAGGEENT